MTVKTPKTKHYRAGVKKIKKEVTTIAPPDTVQKLIPHTNDQNEPTELHQICIKPYCFDEYLQDGQLDYLSKVFGAARAVDVALLKSIHSSVSLHHEHRNDKSSPYESSKVTISIDVKSQHQVDAQKSVLEYLHRGRQTILTHDFNQKNYFDELLRKITELVIDVNYKVHVNPNLEYDSHANRISLAKAIEKLSGIKRPLNGDCIFGIYSPIVGSYNVKAIDKCKADNLLGGRYMSKRKEVGVFIVKTIDFTNIESKLVFLFDGTPVNVYITDEIWIKLFNDQKIKLTKDKKIKAKYLVERSPLTNKIVAYYFTDIYIDPAKL
jgi:hypothetical protein